MTAIGTVRRGSRRGGFMAHENARREATAMRVIGDVARNTATDCHSCDPRKPESLCADCRAILLEVAQ